MPEGYHPAGDRAPPAQLTLDLTVRPDGPVALGDLLPGERFVQVGTEIEGRLLGQGTGFVTVAARGGGDRWVRTTWSPATQVRRLQG